MVEPGFDLFAKGHAVLPGTVDHLPETPQPLFNVAAQAGERPLTNGFVTGPASADTATQLYELVPQTIIVTQNFIEIFCQQRSSE